MRQPTTLFPHLTVEQNVAYGTRHPPAARPGRRAIGTARAHRSRPGPRRRLVRWATPAGGPRKGPREPVSRAAARRAPVGGRRRRPRGAAPARNRDLSSSTRRPASSSPTTSPRRRPSATGSAIIDDGTLLQMGGSREVVLLPRSTAAWPSWSATAASSLFRPSPTAVTRSTLTGWCAGTAPERGVVLNGTSCSTRPFGPRYECTVAERSGRSSRSISTSHPHVDEAMHASQRSIPRSLRPEYAVAR